MEDKKEKKKGMANLGNALGSRSPEQQKKLKDASEAAKKASWSMKLKSLYNRNKKKDE